MKLPTGHSGGHIEPKDSRTEFCGILKSPYRPIRNCQNLIFFLGPENRNHAKFEFSFSSSFRDINLLLILIWKLQNVPSALGY